MDGLLMEYFVLNPAGDDAYALASREAMRAYAANIKGINYQMAKELEAWVDVEAQPKISRGK